MNALASLLEQGQSVWYDFISREFIATGEMARLVELGVRGMTSNPTIFEKAIAGGTSYDDQIRDLATTGASTSEVAIALFVEDVRNACDVLRGVYNTSNGADGFVSLEVNPKFARLTAETVTEARLLWKLVDRPNLMVKIPATDEGFPAIRTCLAEGININITLMFSIEQYRGVAEAYLAGLEERLDAGGDISGIASVASVFVSRIDSLIDGLLAKKEGEEATELQGKAGLANTKLVYQEFKEIFSGPRWERLAAAGARVQRPLWASTSTKNPDYPDLLYVDNLIGPHTVNTLPPDTLVAVLDHANVHPSIEENAEESRQAIAGLEAIGIDVNAAMRHLLDEGVEKFAASFDSLFEKIEAKRQTLVENNRTEVG